MKLEVGMYVRTKHGISKIENISLNEYDKEHDYVELENFVFDGLDTQSFFTTDEIIKASHNIIDLIEVGDYVNCKKVVCKQLQTDNYECDDFWCLFFENEHTGVLEEEIKTIVTKEQFEQMQYKVGE